MGIFNMMRTSISGMNAQSDRLSTISDNVANAGTIGYKKAGAQFSDLVYNETASSYQSGSVQTHVRYDVNMPGSMRTTSDARDLSILGNGFFLVTDRLDGTGEVVLTRAGDFRPDKQGNLRNSAGFYLLTNADSKAVANIGDTSGTILERAEPTKNITVSGNLQFGDTKAATPSDVGKFTGEDEKTYNYKKTMIVTGNHGESISLSVFFIKGADGKWNVRYPDTVTLDSNGDQSKMQVAYKDESIQFDEAGNIVLSKGSGSNAVATGLDALKIKLGPKGAVAAQINLSLAKMTSRAQGYECRSEIDGHADGAYASYEVTEKGELVLKLTNGRKIKKGTINLATVAATDKLLSASGTVFKKTPESGNFIVGLPASGAFAAIGQQQLEQSNVDIATQLTDMIEAQRTYTSNSKVFQAGTEMIDAVLNMVR